jgi:hypothetical protein
MIGTWRERRYGWRVGLWVCKARAVDAAIMLRCRLRGGFQRCGEQQSERKRFFRRRENIVEIGNLIPQVFYDLIARVLPGSVLYVIARTINDEHYSLTDEFFFYHGEVRVPTSIIVMVAISMFYLIGLFAGGIASLVFGLFPKLRGARTGDLPNIDFTYDAVQYHNASAGARLVKLSAEVQLCRVLLVILPVLCVVYAVSNLGSSGSGRFWNIVVSLLGGMMLCVPFYIHVDRRRRLLLTHSWDLVQQQLAAARPGERARGVP